jgi:hypothetical protein
MLLGMLAQTTPQGQAQPFRPGVNQFRAKGVSYRSVLESARVFVRAPPFPVSPSLPRSSEGQAKSELGSSCADTATSPFLDCPVASRRGPDAPPLLPHPVAFPGPRDPLYPIFSRSAPLVDPACHSLLPEPASAPSSIASCCTPRPAPPTSGRVVQRLPIQIASHRGLAPVPCSLSGPGSSG